MHAAIDFPGLSVWLINHSGEKIDADLFKDNDNQILATRALNDLGRLVNGRSEKEIGCALRQLANIARTTKTGDPAAMVQHRPAETD